MIMKFKIYVVQLKTRYTSLFLRERRKAAEKQETTFRLQFSLRTGSWGSELLTEVSRSGRQCAYCGVSLPRYFAPLGKEYVFRFFLTAEPNMG